MLPMELLKKLRAKKNFSSTVSGEEISGTSGAEVCPVLKSVSLAQGINPYFFVKLCIYGSLSAFFRFWRFRSKSYEI